MVANKQCIFINADEGEEVTWLPRLSRPHGLKQTAENVLHRSIRDRNPRVPAVGSVKATVPNRNLQ